MTPEDFFVDSGPSGRRILNREFLRSIQLSEIANRSDAEVAAALLRLAHDELEAYGTDGKQRTSEDGIRHILQACRRLTKRIGIDFDLPFSDFRTFKSHWKANGAVGSWQARRDILDGLFKTKHEELASLEAAAADLQPSAGSTETSPRSHSDPDGLGDGSAASPDMWGLNWDIFISYATEDKETVAGPLARALQELGVDVWYDDFELQIGDSLRRSIDSGIARSRFGLIFLSESFFGRNWTNYELNGLVAQANSDDKRLLPIWHEISKEQVIAYSAALADTVALRTSDLGIDEIANRISAQITSSATDLPAREHTKPPPRRPMRTHAHSENDLILTVGPNRHSFSGVTVSPHRDRDGHYVFLDVRKDPVSRDDYASLCDDLATTAGTDRWHARLDIGGTTFDFDNCEVTPSETTRDSYYVDVRAHTDAVVYRQVVEVLAAAAARRRS